MKNTEKLVEVLRSYRFRYGSESDLQDSVEEVLKDRGIEYEREVKIGPAGRIDFIVFGNIGLEIKIKGSQASVAEQLIRYCESESIKSLILLTGRVNLGQVPSTILGKEVCVIALWESML